MSQAAMSTGYEFAGGFPTPATVRRAYNEADFNRAVQAYRFFYPSVSIMATWKGNLRAGMVENKVFGLLEGTPTQYVFTANSDTPYAGLSSFPASPATSRPRGMSPADATASR